MGKKRPNAIELVRAGSVEVARMASPMMRSTGNPPETPIDAESPDRESGANETVTPPKPHDGANTDSQSSMAQEVLYRIPLEQIAVGGINTRVINEESREFQELVQSIQRDGQLEPILVGVENDHFRLIAGERRYRAVRSAGLSTVLARVTEAPPSDWPRLMLIENVIRQDLSLWEEAAGYRALLATGLTVTDIGEQTAKGKTHVSLVLRIARNPKIVAAYDDGTLSSKSMAKELGSLTDTDGNEIVPGALDAALEYIVHHNPNVHQLRAWIRTFVAGLQDTPARPRRAIRRGTLLKTEQMRLESLLAKVSEMSPAEMSLLARLYEEHARLLRQLSEGVETE